MMIRTALSSRLRDVLVAHNGQQYADRAVLWADEISGVADDLPRLLDAVGDHAVVNGQLCPEFLLALIEASGWRMERASHPFDFDRCTTAEAAAKDRVAQAMGDVPAAWWITRHPRLGESPLSALCAGREADVLALA